MLAQAIMLGFIAGFAQLDGKLFGQMMMDRPLFTGMLVGIVLGDIKTGIEMGAQLELIWMGMARIGAATPPDLGTGGILGIALAMMSGKGFAVALALAVPISLLAQTLGILVRMINSFFTHKADVYAAEANVSGISRCLWVGELLFFLSTFIPTFLAILFGAKEVTQLVNMIPKVILDGMQVAGTILPAVGFALLMDLLFTKKMAPFFFLGFLAAAYGKMDVMSIALFAACIAVILHIYIAPKKDDHNDHNDDNLTKGEINFE